MRRSFYAAVLIVASLGLGALGAAVSEVTAFETAAQVQPSASPSDPSLPTYKPRKDNAPRARIGSSVRGDDSIDPVVVALVPDHVGFTIKSDPSLCWFLSRKTPLPIALTVLDSRAIRPVLETPLPASAQPGFHCIHLRNHGLSLKEREQYRWFITITVDPDKPSRDIVAGGMIERIPFDEACALNLPCSWATCEKEAVYRYADAGLWYDAITCLIELVEATPDDQILRKMLDHLLRQSDLHLPSGA